MTLRELNREAERYGCEVVTAHLIRQLAKDAAEGRRARDLLRAAALALLTVHEDIPKRHVRLRRRVQRIRRGLLDEARR